MEERERFSLAKRITVEYILFIPLENDLEIVNNTIRFSLLTAYYEKKYNLKQT